MAYLPKAADMAQHGQQRARGGVELDAGEAQVVVGDEHGVPVVVLTAITVAIGLVVLVAPGGNALALLVGEGHGGRAMQLDQQVVLGVKQAGHLPRKLIDTLEGQAAAQILWHDLKLTPR